MYQMSSYPSRHLFSFFSWASLVLLPLVRQVFAGDEGADESQ